jgi:hypothetical protein
MRVISQDGKEDFPYENFVIGITNDNVIVATRDVESPPEKLFHSVIASYSNEEKAIKAMELLRACYQHSEEHKHCGEVHYGVRFVFQFPQDDEIYVKEEEDGKT